MGCRNRMASEEESAFSSSLSDALLFATMCIIGLPVDVHITDGSIYSGIFHTACVENEYAIVLKKARITRKGNCVANVPKDGEIETLVVTSEDLLQVIAKGLVLPAESVAENVAKDSVETVELAVSSTNIQRWDPIFARPSNSCSNVKHNSQTRSSAIVENGFSDCFSTHIMCAPCNSSEVAKGELDEMYFTKEEVICSSLVDVRQTRTGTSQGKQIDYINEFQKEHNSMPRDEVQPSGSDSNVCNAKTKLVENVDATTLSKTLPCVVPCDNFTSPVTKIVDDYRHQENHCPECVVSSDATLSGSPTCYASVLNATPNSCPDLSSSLDDTKPPKGSHSRLTRTAKESKLNPEAKIFSPSFAHHRSSPPPLAPPIASMTYAPDNCSVLPIATVHPRVDVNPYVPGSTLPIKMGAYSNSVAGNVGVDAQYSQPIIGHMHNRTQPVRYASQYHPVQSVQAYAHSNTQNVMVGRVGPFVYVQPVSNDMVQSATALSQVSMRPLPTPQQVHLSKQQGNGGAHTLQLYAAPPLLANAQQPFVVPSHVPISQPPYPAIHPNSVIGSHCLLGSKFT